jgi:hypothetical protein
MTESTVGERLLQRWYARPVFFVSDVQGADPDGNELLFPLPSE